MIRKMFENETKTALFQTFKQGYILVNWYLQYYQAHLLYAIFI